MPTPEEHNLIQYLTEVMNRTKSGAIDWVRANPTTYSWTKKIDQTAARMVVQKVDKPERVRDAQGRPVVRQIRQYVLQVTDARTNAQILSVTSTEMPELAELLGQLYETISQNISQKGIDFLRNMLEK